MGSAGSGGGAAFLAGATGLALDEDPDGAAGALAKRPCLSLGSEMVAICGEQVSPGVCSRPFKEEGGVPVLAGSREAKGDQSSAEDQRLYLSLVKKCNLLLSIARFPEGDPAILKGQGGPALLEISTRDITKVNELVK